MARPVNVQVGPLATADPDGATTTSSAPAARYLVLNGALTNGGTANNVAQSQTPTGANAVVTLNGTLASSVPTGTAVAYLGYNERIYITSASDISNRTFTISGLVMSPNGLFAQTETLTGPNANVVASQKRYYQINSITISNTAAGAITVGRAGFATFDLARRVLVTSGGSDTGITFTITGTDRSGILQTEVLTGGAATAQSALSFLTVTDILTSGATASTVTIGTNGVADSQWVRFDTYGAMAEVAIQVNSTGTVNWTVQQTLYDPMAYGSPVYGNPAGMTWVNHPDTALVASALTGVQGNYAYTPLFARVVLNSGTGTVFATFAQTYQS